MLGDSVMGGEGGMSFFFKQAGAKKVQGLFLNSKCVGGGTQLLFDEWKALYTCSDIFYSIIFAGKIVPNRPGKKAFQRQPVWCDS